MKTSTCPSHYLLAAWHSGELDPQACDEVAAHVADCARCAAGLAQVREDDEQFGASEAPERFRAALAAEVQRALRETRPARRGVPWLRPLGAFAAMAAVALILVVWWPREGVREMPAPDGVDRALPTFRGALSWQLVVKRGSQQSLLRPGELMQPDDAIRIVLLSDRAGYATLFSLDARGVISPLYPATDPRDDPAPLAIGGAGRHELPGSIALDETPGAEHLVMVFAEQVFDRAAVHKHAARELARAGPAALTSDGLPIAGQVKVLTVRKAQRPNGTPAAEVPAGGVPAGGASPGSGSSGQGGPTSR